LKIKLGLPSSLFANLNLKESLSELSKLNLEAVEIVFDKPHIEASKISESKLKSKVKDALRSLNPKVELSAHACFQEINLADLNSTHRMRNLRLVGRCLKISAALDLKIVVIHPGYIAESAFKLKSVSPRLESKARSLFEASIKECLRMAEEHGVILALENIHGAESLIQTPSEASRLAGKFEGLRLTVDVGHLYLEARRRGLGENSAEKWVAEEIERLPKGLLVHLHLHDNHGFNDDHLPPSMGKIKFKPIIKALKALEFKGQVILEVWSPEKPLEAGVKALREARRLFS
jgi:sugar phosphate isomerase/epimerase